jgi:dihydroorotate dehydrogenase (fumarate)
MNLETSYLGLHLRHPIITGPSPLSATLDGVRRLEDAGAAAIVTASINEEESRAVDAAFEAGRLVGAESHSEVTGYFPPLPGYRGALATHVEMIARAAKSISVPLVASLNGSTHESWNQIAIDLANAGAAALELNVFDIPTDPRETSAEAEGRLVVKVREVCEATKIPVAIRLSPYFTAPAHLALALAKAGARGIVLFNRWYEPDIDLETMTFRPALRLSTAEDIRVPLMWIALLAGRTSLSLAGGRGVEGSQEVIKYMLAGADVVVTSSSLLHHGPKHLGRMVTGLADWLDAHGANSIAEVRGRLCAERMARSDAVSSERHFRGLLPHFPAAFHGDYGDTITSAWLRGQRVQ